MISRRLVALLALGNGVETVTQALLPIALVRLLGPADFGGFRQYVLAALTAAMALSLSIPQSLVYQMPLQPLERRGLLLGNALAYLAVAGLLAAAVYSPGVGLVNVLFGKGSGSHWLLPAFALLYMMSLPFEQLGLIVGRPGDQAWLTVGQALLRTGLILVAATLFRSLLAVGLALVLFAMLRLLATLIYAHRSGAFSTFGLHCGLARYQLRYGMGFGLGSTLTNLRFQVDGWTAALVFDPVAVAGIGIAAGAAPLGNVIRSAFTNAITPSIAAAVAEHRLADALAANREANLITGCILVPATGALIALAHALVPLVFTQRMAFAVVPFQIYCGCMIAAAFETTTLIFALKDGRFPLLQGAILLPVTALLCVLGAKLFALPGITLGLLIASWIGVISNLVYVARKMKVPWAEFQAWREVAEIIALTALAVLAARLVPAWVPSASAITYLLLQAPVYLIIVLGGIGVSPRLRAVYRRILTRGRGTLPPAASLVA